MAAAPISNLAEARRAHVTSASLGGRMISATVIHPLFGMGHLLWMDWWYDTGGPLSADPGRGQEWGFEILKSSACARGVNINLVPVPAREQA